MEDQSRKTQYLSQDEHPYSTTTYHSRWYQRVWYHIKWVYYTVKYLALIAGNFGLPNVRVSSEYVESVIYRPVKLRQLFLTRDVITIHPHRNSHSHPRAASYRTTVNIYINDLATKAGYIPYNVSRSATDSGDGTRYFYGAKDLGIPFCDDTVTNQHCICMCDVDYYTDIGVWMQYFRPIVLYTFIPNSVVGRREDYCWRVDGNDVEFHVNGGSSYRHGLWEYTNDVVGTYARNGDLLIFNLEQREIEGDEDHRLVVLTPMAAVPPPFHWFLPPIPMIKRKKMLFDSPKGPLQMLYEPVKDMLSLSVKGSWQSVETTGRIYSAIEQRLQCKTAPPLISDVERLLRAAGDESAAINAPLLFNMFGLKLEKNVVRTTKVPTHYLPLGTSATEDGKDSGTQVTGPLVTQPALFASRGYNADEATINGRVNKVRNPIVPPRSYKEYATEFVSLVVGKPGVGSPLSAIEVHKRQATAQQKARFKMVEATLTTTPHNRLEAFVKAEPYSSVNDPRNITTMSPELTVMLSSYTLAFKEDVLKKHRWYGPGLNPKRTLKRLADMQAKGRAWLCGDYCRFDGTISEFLQKHVVYPCYMQWVAEEYRAELKGLLDRVFIRRGRTKENISFDPGYGTRSGSPITTDGNTKIAAYVKFCALRRMGYTPKQAFDMLGLKYGDDGVDEDEPGLIEHLIGAAKDLGLKLEIQVFENGKPFPYLGRYFVDPLTSQDSFQDPLRTISKLHLTANKAVTPTQAAANKAHGYWITDSKTPIVGTWAKRVIEITGLKPKGLLREEQHRMSNAWPQKDRDLITQSMADVLGISEGELELLDQSVAQVQALDQFGPILETELKVKIPAVVDGMVVEPEPRISDTPQHVAAKQDRAQVQLRQVDDTLPSSSRTPSTATGGKATRVRRQVQSPRNVNSEGGRPRNRGRRPPDRRVLPNSKHDNRTRS
jgi:hypothetical protein